MTGERFRRSIAHESRGIVGADCDVCTFVCLALWGWVASNKREYLLAIIVNDKEYLPKYEPR